MTQSRSICSLLAAAFAAGALFLGSAGGALAHHHHHHHHGDGWASGGGPFGTGPVHGPGSSHNPIIYHPVPSTTVVRDHRRPAPRPGHHYNPHCNHRDITGCPNVRDHRKPPVTFQSIFNLL